MTHFARKLRTNPTEAERRLWSRLRKRQLGGFKFRRQHAIGAYICDFACLDAKLIIELDGSQHFDNTPYDDRRDASLQAAGFRVIRFWNGDVVSRLDGVLETISHALHHETVERRYD